METLVPMSKQESRGERFLASEVQYLDRVAERIKLDRNIHRYLSRPKRELRVSIPVLMDSGELELFTGYRIQHILAVGPTKGGIQYGPEVDVETLRALAMANTWKNAVVGLHFGGAEGGVRCDPQALSADELERLTRRYASEINIVMGPEKDIPEPDDHTDERIMAWIMDTYSMDVGFSVPGVVTGKPRCIGGSAAYVETQAWGAVYVVREVLRRRGESVKGWRIGLQGASPLALQVGRLLQAEGARVEALSDRPCDAVLLTGGDYRVVREDVPGLKTRVLIEVAPFVVASDLDEALQQAGILHIPNILTQAGAVTAQYVEWVQDIQAFFWDDAEVSQKLEYLLNNCLRQVFETAETVNGNLRMASHMIAVSRVAEAVRLRGIYP